jgi:hypothetical protein
MAGGFLLDAEATIVCPHGGQARPTSPSPRVKLSGKPAVTNASSYAVTGCTLVPPVSPPDVAAQFVTAATRVRSGGASLLLSTSQGVATPTGSPVTIVAQQVRVKGT